MYERCRRGRGRTFDVPLELVQVYDDAIGRIGGAAARLP
ncbi:hypothetical protein NORO109296_19685 [Nocardiopsis rhodophaea]